MRKALICAFALSGFAATAQAADLDLGGLKDPLPDTITWKGVTLYGTIDVGAAYQNHGAPISSFGGAPLNYSMFGAAANNKSLATIASNAMEQSKIGLNIEEQLGYGITAIAKIEAGFVPTSGELADGCKTLILQNGKQPGQQDSSGDSSRCGQTFSGPVYAGLSSPTYGTLTVGRQNTLQLDALAKYDPQNLSYAFSLLGFTGSVSGAGTTEDARWDDSIKYVYQYGPVHVGGMYTAGGQETATLNGAWGVDIGGEYRGFSIDALYQKTRGNVSSAPFGFSPLQGGAQPAGTCQANAGALPSSISSCPNGLAGTVSDDQSWSVEAKYSFDVGGGGYKDGGYKDAYVPGGKITIYGGYEHMMFGNPRDVPVAGTSTIGGYVLSSINAAKYTTDANRDLEWAGIKYEIDKWTLTSAYYHLSQDSFITNSKVVNPGGLSATTATNNNCAAIINSNVNAKAAGRAFGNVVGNNCAGEFNQVSFVADYRLTKHFDVYAGVDFSNVSGVFDSGFLQHEQVSVVTGMRLKF